MAEKTLINTYQPTFEGYGVYVKLLYEAQFVVNVFQQAQHLKHHILIYNELIIINLSNLKEKCCAYKTHSSFLNSPMWTVLGLYYRSVRGAILLLGYARIYDET